ncbi:MAG TPA: AMP-binding protein [Acidimicrobiales bacterium]|nr:AMP-binding protein [Acidimicrobiales bacterium]
MAADPSAHPPVPPASVPPAEPGAQSARGVAAVAEADPDRVAIVFEGRRVTFRQLDREANAWAHALAPHVPEPGMSVAVALPNGVDVLSAWHGVARLGALIVPINTRLTAGEVAYLLSDSGARALVHDGSEAAIEAAAQTTTPTLTVADVAGAGRGEGPDRPPRTDYIASPVTTMTYTSGTTGRPKGIVRPAPPPAVEAPPSPFASFWGFASYDVHLMCGPVYHTAPSAYALMHLVEGARVVVMAKWDAAEALRLIESEQVTTSQMVPAQFIRILEADWQKYDLSSVRKILHAAAPCPVPVKRRIVEVFPPGAVWEYYGASEGMASVISPEEWLRKPGSVGRAFPSITVRILDDDGRELPAGEVGAVYISAFAGRGFEYHNAPDKTRSAWRDGFFTVGDMGWLDEDGYLFLADRRTDLILSGGVNIYPAEVETALIEEPDVVDAAVFGLPDERMGQRVHAVVELRPGMPRDEEELRRRLGLNLADFKLPRTIEFVDELPREPNGKVLKTRLREERTRGPREETP